MVDDEPLGRKLLKTSRKGKEKMDEFPDLTSTKEREVDDEAVVVTNYRRAIINGKAKMVEVADVQESNVKAETNELPKNYFVFEVHYDGVFSEYPLRCNLGEGLTIVEDDGDMKKLYAIAEKYGLVNLCIAHIPENLAEYYFKILTLDAFDEEVKSKVKSHENRKLDASAMSPHELVEWAEQEAGSPYLRTPSIKPRRKCIELPCKNLFGDFLHCDSVADEIVLHDNWKYEGLSLDGPIDVRGPTTWCDLVHECVVENGDSLPIMDKECFSNNVVLDDVVPANRKSTPLLLMKKGRNKVSFTRKSRCVKNSKTFSLRKGCGKRVACGANTRRLGGLMGLNVQTFRARKGWGKRVACGDNTRKLGGLMALNVHVVDEVSQVTKQGSMSAGSSQHRG
ncbi:hypothetical protein Tco_0348073 [Tanacetum coccineum]